MIPHHFDTLSVSKRLKNNGFSEAQAEALAEEMQFAHEESLDDLATKTELMTVKTELRTEIQAVKTELRTEIQAVRTDLKADMKELETTLVKSMFSGFFGIAALMLGIFLKH